MIHHLSLVVSHWLCSLYTSVFVRIIHAKYLETAFQSENKAECLG